MNRSLWILALVISLCSGCNHDQPAESKQKHARPELVKIRRGQLSSQIKLPGQLKAFERVDIYPKVNGFVKDMYVDRGSIVKAGQILMTLDAPEIEQELRAANDKFLQAQETMNASKDRYFRLKTASQKAGAVSQIELFNAASKFQADSAFLQSERANVNGIETMKSYLTVRASFDGIITERNVHPGTLIGPNFKTDSKPLLVLQENNKLRLEVFVPEEYVEDLAGNDKQISFTTAAIQGKTFQANITRRSAALNESYRSEAVEADVNNPNGLFMPGMYVEVRINIASKPNAFIVPASAVVTSTERRYLIADDNGHAKFIAVTVGISQDGQAEVFGDLSGNESIVMKPNTEMREGANM